MDSCVISYIFLPSPLETGWSKACPGNFDSAGGSNMYDFVPIIFLEVATLYSTLSCLWLGFHSTSSTRMWAGPFLNFPVKEYWDFKLHASYLGIVSLLAAMALLQIGGICSPSSLLSWCSTITSGNFDSEFSPLVSYFFSPPLLFGRKRIN